MSMMSLKETSIESHSDTETLLVDFFDTCVTRDVHPEYIKYLWAAEIREQLGLRVPADETYRIRAGIELELCVKNKNFGNDDDFFFPEFSAIFYQHIHKLYKDLQPLLSQEEFVELSTKVEVQLEIKHQILLDQTISYLDQEKKSGKELILVSDFYLSKNAIEQILKHHKIHHLFSKVYVSSEYQKTKRSGKLYDLVISECSLTPQKTTMIGDNLHSDFECPKTKGLNAIHLDRSLKKSADEELFLKEQSLDLTRQEIWNKVNPILGNGPIFSNITLTLYSFINRLYRKLREDNVKDVFFLSREGEFLKKIFDLYQSTLIGEESITSHYFLASRKSTFLPSLKSIEEENFEILFRQYINISGRDFLLSLNLEEFWVNQFIESSSLDFETREENFSTSDIFNSIVSNELFKKEYEKRRTQQKENFLSYINSFGVSLDSTEFSIVDVGWKGSMQDNLRKILSENTCIHGYYLGLFTSPNTSETNKKEGIIFSPLPEATEYGAWIFSNTLSVYEILLGASHGSATEYIRDTTGKIDVRLSAHPYETQLFNDKISPLLDSYYLIFEKLCSIFGRTHFNIEYFDRMIAEFHASMVLLPTEEELKFIETISHFENFGVFEFSEFTSDKVPLNTKFDNTIQFFRNPHILLKDSMWPALTFKTLGISFLRHLYGWYQFQLAFGDGRSKAFNFIRRIWRI